MSEEPARDKSKRILQSISKIEFNWQKGGLIGSGAFGKVFLGLNLDTGQLMAVKQISIVEEFAQEPKEVLDFQNEELTCKVQGFEHEVSMMRNLLHENIVQYYGTSIEDNHLNIFLEYVPGGSISSLLNKFGGFSESVVRVYTRQILSGLAYLHQHQIIHRGRK